jgi:hypothetical protein
MEDNAAGVAPPEGAHLQAQPGEPVVRAEEALAVAVPRNQLGQGEAAGAAR